MIFTILLSTMGQYALICVGAYFWNDGFTGDQAGRDEKNHECIKGITS